jgi:hypothetical protein
MEMSEDNQGRINGWACDECGRITYVVHVDSGVTPMFLACRAEGVEPDEASCKGRGVSLMYPDESPPQHVLDAVKWEWYRPTDLSPLSPEMRDHIEKGGVALRSLTAAGRALLKPDPKTRA